MRKQIPAILLALMLGLCGCSGCQTIQTTEPTGETEKITETAEAGETERLLSSESRQEEPAETQEETEIPESPAQAAEPEEAEPQETKKQAKADEAKSGKPAEIEKPENTKAPAKAPEANTQKAEENKPAETEKVREAQQETMPSDEPPAPSVTEAPAQKTAYDFEFDMESIKADCISIGQSMGLTLDASLTPSNAAYWNPVTASPSNQGEALKRNLESYVKFHTVENLGSYGMDEITDFNIYYEARGNGAYLIYFLFA